jgi:aspartyl-tRNA(Asn)/glutamyl-tRNA(Gln) amidotransferase subunit A
MSASALQRARRRIAELNHLNAFISLTDEKGDGQIVAVKDLIDVRNTVTTGGGVILPTVRARADAPLIERIRRHGCIVIGKTNLHEWAFGPTNINPHYGSALNPHDVTRITGGSSGGSALAVATEMCDWAIGTDTGGSIRLPASLCGVVGFKPSPGLISTEGVIPLSQSLDTVGPLARDVLTAAHAFEMMSDIPISVPEPPFLLDRFRLAIPEGWVDGLDESTSFVWKQVSRDLTEIPFPDRARLSGTAMTILHAEAAANHREWLVSHRDRYGPDVLALLEIGMSVSAVSYVEALAERERLSAEVEAAMHDWDALILPATACVAPKLDDANVREPLTRFTRPFNLTRQPVIVIPAPTQGLPVGIQIVGHSGRDAALVRVALALESHLKQPVK